MQYDVISAFLLNLTAAAGHQPLAARSILWSYLGIMEKKMETTRVYCGY